MRPWLLGLALACVGSSCTITRSISLPAVRPLALGEPTRATFTLDDVSWAPPTGESMALHDFTGVTAAGTAHAKDVLGHSESVGVAQAASEHPQFAVEVAISHSEAIAPNPLITVPLVAYTGLLVGAGIAAATAPPVAIGLAAGALGSLSAGNFLPTETFAATLSADVRVRRASDGVEIATRKCSVSWREHLSPASWRDGWARSLGLHLGELEQEVGRSLRDVFRASQQRDLHADAQ